MSVQPSRALLVCFSSAALACWLLAGAGIASGQQTDAPEKPAEVKPAEEKPAAEKPADAKPQETPAAEAKPENKEPPKDKPAEPAKENGKEPKPEEGKPEQEKPEQGKDKGKEKAKEKEAEKKPIERRLPNLGSTTNTPLPGQPWRIHDLYRPQPPKVSPGATDQSPPSDAIVLFDGKDMSMWYHRGSTGEDLIEPKWKVQDGYMEITAASGSVYTLDSFGSCQLHIEWAAPEEVKGDSQNRGNSGIKLMERFEVQVLDSFNNRTYADGQAGSLYGQYPPLVSAIRKPGEWQTYDIIFEAPVMEEGKLIKPAYATVIHNGVLVHHHRELAGPTGIRPLNYQGTPQAAPLMLQDHGSPVRYRNIWIRRL